MQWMTKLAKLRCILVFLGAAVLSLVVISILENALAGFSFPGILDRQTGFTYDSAYRQIGTYTEQAKVLYTGLQAADMGFLLGYGFFFASLIALLVQKLLPDRPRWLWLSAIGLGAAACDCMENIGIFTMVRLHPAPYPALAALTSAAGVVKMGLFYIAVPLIITGAVVLLVRRIRAKGKKS